jgi:hypothetical protein
MTQAYFCLQNPELWSINFLYNVSLCFLKKITTQPVWNQYFEWKSQNDLFTLIDSLASISQQITQRYFFSVNNYWGKDMLNTSWHVLFHISCKNPTLFRLQNKMHNTIMMMFIHDHTVQVTHTTEKHITVKSQHCRKCQTKYSKLELPLW